MKINIPIPCNENWEDMTSQEKGRFCESCQKMVIDFTQMSNEEIFDYFKNQNHQKSTCGRFQNEQLFQINQQNNTQEITKNFFLKKLLQKTAFWGSTFLFFFGNTPQKTFAQKEIIKTEEGKSPNTKEKTEEKSENNTSEFIIIEPPILIEEKRIDTYTTTTAGVILVDVELSFETRFHIWKEKIKAFFRRKK